MLKDVKILFLYHTYIWYPFEFLWWQNLKLKSIWESKDSASAFVIFGIRIQIHHFKWIRIRIQGVDQKFKKKMQLIIFVSFLLSKIFAIYLSLGLLKKDVQGIWKDFSPSKKSSCTLKCLFTFFSFCGSVLSSFIRIRIHNAAWHWFQHRWFVALIKEVVSSALFLFSF